MDPKNSGPDYVLCRDLKVLLQQSFNSLLQVFVTACSSLSFYPSYVVTILCVITRIVMLRHSQLCRDIVYVQLLQIDVAA